MIDAARTCPPVVIIISKSWDAAQNFELETASVMLQSCDAVVGLVTSPVSV